MWHCDPDPYAYKNYNLTEAQDNAKEIRNWLSSFGWTDNAICAFLGNVHTEGAYNPWCWERQSAPYYNPPTRAAYQANPTRARGYGLVQFTPAQKYIDSATYYNNHPDPGVIHDPVNYPAPPQTNNMQGYNPYFADTGGGLFDGVAQLYFVNYYADYYDSIPGTSIPGINYAQYKASTDSVAWLTEVWLRNYERPNEQTIIDTLPERTDAAEFWWTFFTGLPPEPPTPPGPTPTPTKKKRSIVILAGSRPYIQWK